MAIRRSIPLLDSGQPHHDPARTHHWYNTKCPVYDAGIARQRNKLVSAVKAGTIEFHDINVEPQALAAFGADVMMCVDACMPWTKADG
jgi:hypothetical protein